MLMRADGPDPTKGRAWHGYLDEPSHLSWYGHLLALPSRPRLRRSTYLILPQGCWMVCAASRSPVSSRKRAMSQKGPTVVDVVVTRDPAKMLPGVDNRAAKIKKGDRLAWRRSVSRTSVPWLISWWAARQDSNLQPDRYERQRKLFDRWFSSAFGRDQLHSESFTQVVSGAKLVR
jgi:hypothetical protein